MTVANLKIGKRTFVVVPERDFDRMQRAKTNNIANCKLEEDHALGSACGKGIESLPQERRQGDALGAGQEGTGFVAWRMRSYSPTAARRSLGVLPAHVQKRVQRWIDLLAEDPRRAGTRQLEGHPGIRAYACKQGLCHSFYH